MIDIENVRLHHDTGMRKEALIDLRLEDLDLDTLRPRIIVTQKPVLDDNIISPELGPRTARDLRAYIEAMTGLENLRRKMNETEVLKL